MLTGTYRSIITGTYRSITGTYRCIRRCFYQLRLYERHLLLVLLSVVGQMFGETLLGLDERFGGPVSDSQVERLVDEAFLVRTRVVSEPF